MMKYEIVCVDSDEADTLFLFLDKYISRKEYIYEMRQDDEVIKISIQKRKGGKK